MILKAHLRPLLDPLDKLDYNISEVHRDDVHIFPKKHGYDFQTKPFLCFNGDVFLNINSKMLWHLTILSSIFRLYSMHSLVASKYR